MPRPLTPEPALRRVTRGADTSEAVRVTALPGGLRVVTEFIPAVHSASVGVWVGVGSRDEGTSVAGAAHFLEHLLFKSTPTRSAVDIAQAVDAIGGELNAFTAREHELLEAMARGMDNLQIAAHLGLAEKTVRNLLSRLYGKLALEGRPQAIVWARERGFGRR